MSLTANFILDPAKLDYSIELNSTVGGNAQLVSASNPLSYESNVTIQALTSDGYSFTEWTSASNSLNLLSSAFDPLAYIVVDRNSSFTANFQEKKYFLTVGYGSGGHSVTPLGTTLHSHFSSVTISATPATGFAFKNWDDPKAILNSTSAALTEANMSKASGDANVTALFEPKQYLVEINSTTGGSVSLDNPTGPWLHFENYALVATPDPGYIFKEWTGESTSINSLTGTQEESNNSLNLTQSVSLTANFDPISYQVTLNSNGDGNVTGDGNYTVLELVTAEATPATGWNFTGWTGDSFALQNASLSSSAINLSAFPQNISLTANFDRKNYSISFDIEGNGSINNYESNFTESHAFEDFVTYTPTPSNGWKFVNWVGVTENQKFSNPLGILVNDNVEIKSIFARKSYTLEINSAANGQTSGDAAYLFEDNVSITANPDPGYLFTRWDGDFNFLNDRLSSNNVFQMPDSNISLLPFFPQLSIP